MSLLNPDEVTLDPQTDYLAELVGPGKKYKDQAELAKAYFHADKTIEIQNRRMDQMRSDYERERTQNLTRAQLEEVMTRYSQTPLGEAPQQPDVQKPQIDMTQVESLISSKISHYERQKIEDQNFNTVKNKLIEKFGANYSTAIGPKINELGMTPEELDSMARTKPQVLINALGLNAPATQNNSLFQAPVRSSFQTPFTSTGPKERTWTYYQDLKAKDPKAYRSEKIQNQMTADYVRLGASFEDGDFHSQFQE